MYGGFYTQDDIREVVAYAKARYVNVVPEIEMPGHSRAALAAYPDVSCRGGPFKVSTVWNGSADVFCPGKEQTFEFIDPALSGLGLLPQRFVAAQQVREKPLAFTWIVRDVQCDAHNMNYSRAFLLFKSIAGDFLRVFATQPAC